MKVLKVCVSYINKARKYKEEMSNKYSSLRNKTGQTEEEAENLPSRNTLVSPPNKEWMLCLYRQ